MQKFQKKFSHSSKEWLQRQWQDHFVKQAKQQGYRSRAAFKIEAIDEAFKIFNSQANVLDLGAAPGSWCQYIVKKVQNTVYAIDLLPIKAMPRLVTGIGDITDDVFIKNFLAQHSLVVFDVIVSDISPNLIGHMSTDHIRFRHMFDCLWFFTQKHLAKGGHFVTKVRHGCYSSLDTHFKSVRLYKPDACRKESGEIYLVCKGFKGIPAAT